MHVSLGELVGRQRNCDLKPGDNNYTVKIPKVSPRAYIFQRPFLRGLSRASLTVGSKFTVFALFLYSTLYLRAIFHVRAPGRLIFGGAI